MPRIGRECFRRAGFDDFYHPGNNLKTDVWLKYIGDNLGCIVPPISDRLSSFRHKSMNKNNTPLLYSSLSLFSRSCPPDFPTHDRQVGVTARLSDTTPIPLFGDAPTLEVETQLPSFINHTRGELTSFDDADGLIRSKSLEVATYCREVAAELISHAERLERRALEKVTISEKVLEELKRQDQGREQTTRQTARPVSIPSFSKGSAHRSRSTSAHPTKPTQPSLPSPADLDYLDDL